MTIQEVIQIGGAILVSLGGASAVLFGFSSWLGKVWADRLMEKEKTKYSTDLERFKSDLSQTAESHKVKLKKSEFIFQKEFEAASALVALNRDIVPTYSHPDMDWYDACDEMAMDFGIKEVKLHAYLKEHGAILPAGVKHLVTICFGIAGQEKFNATRGSVYASANAGADLLYGHLKQAELEIIEKINGQIVV